MAKDLELEQANAELWRSYTQSRDPKLREQLILQYMPLVKFVMGRLTIFSQASFDYDDALSEGTVGLIVAIDRFDATHGVKFQTYAMQRIRGAIIDDKRKHHHLSRPSVLKGRAANEAISTLYNDLGRDPTDKEVAEFLGVSLERYLKDRIISSRVVISLEMHTATGGSRTDSPRETIADPDAEDITLAIEREELAESLRAAMHTLPERDQMILHLWYGNELTLSEIGQRYNITKQRVGQIKVRALKRLRLVLADDPIFAL